MAGTAPVFYDQAKLKIDNTWITIGSDLDLAYEWDEATSAGSWDVNKVKKPIRKNVNIVINFEDMVGHVDTDALDDMSDGVLHTFEAYPEGDAAGARMYSGSCYVRTSGLKGAAASGAVGVLTLNVSGALTKSPNLALSTEAFGSVAAGAAASGYTSPTASGGTSTYTITMEDENGVPSALPEGVTWSGSAWAGTVDAGANVGMYRIKVKVVDSAATPVVKYFLCTMRVTA